MPRFAAFLRGMNVGGHRITNGDLRGRFEELGLREASTFRASGNVIFAGPHEPLADTARHIEEGLAASLGYEVPVFLRTASEVRAIAGHQPFAQPRIAASKGKLQVVLLSARPASSARREVLALASDADRLGFGDSELFWLPSGGILESALDFRVIGELLGPMTTRTKGTIEQIAAKYFSPDEESPRGRSQ
jgi:uncharacterized protein (DUF1697 family)